MNPLVHLLKCSAAAFLIASLVPATQAAEDARTLLDQAEALQRDGHRHAALEILERARAIADSARDERVLPRIEGALGKAYLLRGRTEDARVLLTRALQSAEAAGNARLAAAVLNDLGNLAVSAGNPSEAAAFYQRSLGRSRESGARSQAAKAAANIVRLHLNQAQVQPALAGLADLKEATDGISDEGDKVSALVARGELLDRLYGATGDRRVLQQAHAAQSEALSLATHSQDLRGIARARGGLAQLYLADRRYDEAAQLAALALAAAQAGNATDLLYRWHWLEGRILRAQDKTEAALRAYRRAIASFQFVRLDLIQELGASGTSYRDAVGPLFIELADVLLRRAKSADGRQAELAEARDVIEQLRSVELEDYFKDECVARLQARKKTIEQVAADTAVIYPIFLEDRTELLLSIGGRMTQHAIAASPGELTKELHEFRKLLEKRTTHEYLPYAQRLYAWIFGPIAPALREHGIATIVLVPEGPLRGIPLAALHDGKEFLVSRYAFATAPGLSLLEPRPLAANASNVLLSGLSESVQQFPPLPFVVKEMSAIEKLTKAKSLHNAQFRASSFEKELKSAPYSVVHIASHGQFDSDPKKSFLLTFDGKITMDDLEQYMKVTRFRDEPVELLTLSACRTAAGDDRAALGLAGVAVKAGARSALATLWFINDQASSELLSSFYELLRAPSASKAGALQAAQKRMLADAQYRHPGYWAPFLLIGNWL